jgi:hypothetical protein
LKVTDAENSQQLTVVTFAEIINPMNSFGRAIALFDSTGVIVDKKQLGNAAGDAGAEDGLEYVRGSEPSARESIAVRAARAKLIEQTCHKLTDQLTVIHGQTQILGERLPAVLHDDLLTIRNAVMKGMEFNKRVLEAALECQREVGI